MKKKVLAIFVVICIVCSSFAIAQGDAIFDIIKYNFNIFYNGNELKFDSPVLLINGQTYVPLRDFAEEAKLNVEWNGETEEIMLTYRFLDTESMFARLFGFWLPGSAEIINYAYSFDGAEEYFVAKIFFDESDLEYMRKGIKSFSRVTERESLEDEYMTNFLNRLSKKYSWWDISSTEDIQYAYNAFMEGVEVTTIPVYSFICKADDSGGYYLYIKH